MPKILDERTRTAIQADLVAGEMNINKIAEKHGVGWMTVKNLQKGAGGGGNGRKVHTSAKVASPTARAGKQPGNGLVIELTDAIADALWRGYTLAQKAQAIRLIFTAKET